MRRGITFNGISSVSLGLTMKTTARMVLPSSARGTVSVVKRAGTVDFENDTYGEGIMRLSFSWLTARAEESVKKAELIYAWLYNNGEYQDLIFDNTPYKKYRAKVTSEVSMITEGCRGSVDVMFTINPPMAFLLDNTPLTPDKVLEQIRWDTAKRDGYTYYQEFTSGGDMRITNAGKASVKPLIKLTNVIPNGLTLSYNGAQWQFMTKIKNDSVIIDCAAESVTLGSSGKNLFQYVNPQKDDFFTFSPGSVRMTVSSPDISAWPENLYIVVELIPGGGA